MYICFMQGGRNVKINAALFFFIGANWPTAKKAWSSFITFNTLWKARCLQAVMIDEETEGEQSLLTRENVF